MFFVILHKKKDGEEGCQTIGVALSITYIFAQTIGVGWGRILRFFHGYTPLKMGTRVRPMTTTPLGG
jgi:hypothetical protein